MPEKISEKERQRRLTLHAQGKTDTEMAKILGMSQSGVFFWRKGEGLERNMPPNRVLGIKDNRLELYKQGLIDMEIAKILNLSPSTIRAWRERNGYPRNKHKKEKELKKYDRLHIERTPSEKETFQRLISRIVICDRLTHGKQRYAVVSGVLDCMAKGDVI